MRVQTSRCTGHCCANFTLTVSPMELEHWGKYSNLSKKKERWIDVRKLANMVIYLYSDKMAVNKPAKSGELNKASQERYHYTCKHYDAINGNCMNYEDRPETCRSFNANGNQCTYKDCTCKFGDDGKEDRFMLKRKEPLCKKECSSCPTECK